MYSSLQACLKSIGEVGGDSTNRYCYKDSLDTTKDTVYRQIFLEWYSEQLLKHGERILESAKAIFWGTGTRLSAKVPKALHNHSKDISSHSAPMISGYLYNDGYLRVMKIFGRHGITLNFTCSQMNEIKKQDSANVVPEPVGVLQQMTLKATFQTHDSDSSSSQCTQNRIITSRSVDRMEYSGYGSLFRYSH